LGLTQRELAKELQVSSGAIGFWESGARVIPGPILKLMDAFEHHLNPLSSISTSTRDNFDRQLMKHCEDWTEKLLSSIPTNKDRDQTAILRSTLKRLFHRYLSDHLSRDPIKRTVQIATYSRLVGKIDRSTGLPLKLIQLASYLDPDMPAELRECLSLLQSAITGMPAGVAARIIFEEFGERPSEVFAEWSAKPFATASLGQVHRARLHSGEWVAVKIQYPRIREDLELAFKDPTIQDLLFTLIRSGGGQVLEEFKSRVLEECNYRREADSQRNFRKYFENDKHIRVPLVFSKFSSDRVLTTEFIEGQSFGEFAKTASQETRNWAAETVTRFQGESFFWHNTIYADIHPGNLIFAADQVVFIDYGRVLNCGDGAFIHLAELMLAVLDNDPVRCRKAVEAAEMIRDWKGFNFEEFWLLLREQHCHFWEDVPFAFNKAYVSRKNQLMRSFGQKHALNINGPIFWNFFVVTTHDAVRAELGAKANWRRLILKAISGSPHLKGLPVSAISK
jgi:transcriptional regulator with XRE-family HTH domain